MSDNIKIPKNISNTLMADGAIFYFRKTNSKDVELCTMVPNCMLNNNYISIITPSIKKLKNHTSHKDTVETSQKTKRSSHYSYQNSQNTTC